MFSAGRFANWRKTRVAHALRLFSAPSSPAAKKAAAPPSASPVPAEDGGKASRLILVAFALAAGSLGALSLQFELDKKFRNKYEGSIPGFLEPAISSTRGALRASGLVDILSPKPHSGTSTGSTEASNLGDAIDEIVPPPAVETEMKSVQDEQEVEDFPLPTIEPPTEPPSLSSVSEFSSEPVGSSSPPHDNEVENIGESAIPEGSDIDANFDESSQEPSIPIDMKHAQKEGGGKESLSAVYPPAQVLSTAQETEQNLKFDSSVYALETERRYLSDLDTLDLDGTRKRLLDLAKDFSERSRWDAIKLHQSIKHVEKELTDHYSSLLAKREVDMELKLERELAKREADVRIEMSHIINDLRDAQEFRIQDALRTQEISLKAGFEKEKLSIEESLKKDAEQKIQTDTAMLKMDHTKKLLELHKYLEDARAHVAAFEGVADTMLEKRRKSASVHEESAAILALEAALGKSLPVKNEVAAVRSVCSPGSATAHLLDAIPSATYDTGVPTLSDLRGRYAVAKVEARKAALSPQSAPKMVGQLIGSTLAALSWEAQGYVDGESEEAILARVSFLLDQGKLSSALSELSGLRGYPRTVMQDWESAAKNRLVLDLVVSGLKATVAIDHVERQN